MELRIKKTHPNAIIPTRQKPGDSGLDLHALVLDGPLHIAPGERRRIHTGISIELPSGYEAQVRPRSGLSDRAGVVASLGTIDNGYRGDIGVVLFNLSWQGFMVRDGDRIAQLVIAPVSCPEVVVVIDELAPTERGTGGFGSTGV